MLENTIPLADAAAQASQITEPVPRHAEARAPHAAQAQRELETVLRAVCTEAATAACQQTAQRHRQWLEQAGLPKAIRVAQAETFKLLGQHGVLCHHRSNVGSSAASLADAPLATATEAARVTAFLSDCRAALGQAGDRHPALRRACQTASGALGALHAQCSVNGGMDLPALEAELARIENALTNGLCASVPAAAWAEWEQAARRELRRHQQTMEAEVFAATLQQCITGKVREHYGIPRLDLFYCG